MTRQGDPAAAPAAAAPAAPAALRREEVALLGRCLAFRLEPAELADLRARLLTEAGIWDRLTLFAAEEGLVQAVERNLRMRGLLPSEFLPAGAGLVAPDHPLRAAAAGVAQRRAVLTEHLREIVARLNRSGIEPIVLKGAQSLLTGEPDWRYLRDFDLLVPDRAEAAQEELVAMGFETPEAERRRRHHLPPLVRDGFPGFVEIHRRAGNQYVRTLIPTEELVAAGVPGPDGGAKCRLVPEPLHALYGLVHHHMGHAGDARGTVSLKGLYEFAWALDRMTNAERAALRRRAERHPRLSATVDAWIAAAADLYRLPVPSPFAVLPDAAARWRATFARIGEPRPWYKYPGYPDEIRMGLAGARVRAAPFGGNAAGRAWTRAKVLRSFLPRFAK